MKIVFSCIPFDNGKSGISVYMRSVVSALSEAGHDLTLIVEPSAEKFFPGYKKIKAPAYIRIPVLSMLWHMFILPLRLAGKHFDAVVTGAANRRYFAFRPAFTVSVVHDLSQYHIKGKYDAFRMFYIMKVLPFFIRRSDSVIAISHSTEKDLVKYWRVKPEKISVAYNGLSLQKENGSTNRWCEKHSIAPHGYILYISRIEVPGKNHLNLIKAFELLPPEIKKAYTLVLAGSDWPGAEEVHKYAELSNDASQILFTGFLANEDLPEAYRNAACYVFPSFFEGFGLSLIEAMHYGVPCACSNNSSLGEIGEGAAMLFDPSKPEEISASVRRILSDGALRKSLVDAGSRRSKEFNWAKHAEAIIAATVPKDIKH